MDTAHRLLHGQPEQDLLGPVQATAIDQVQRSHAGPPISAFSVLRNLCAAETSGCRMICSVIMLRSVCAKSSLEAGGFAATGQQVEHAHLSPHERPFYR